MPTITLSEKDYIEQVLERIKEKTIFEGNCWRYTGKKVGKGYGSITYRNKTVRLNRFIAYVFYDLPIDAYLYSNQQANHKSECQFKDCWNPEHIYVGTQKDNVRDAIASGKHHFGTTNLNGGLNFD